MNSAGPAHLHALQTYHVPGLIQPDGAMLDQICSQRSACASACGVFRNADYRRKHPAEHCRVIGAFQYFVPAMLIGGRDGNPQGATLFYNLHFYREAFVFSNMGYASVLALVLFVLVLILTALMFYFAQQTVYYAGADR